MRFLQCTNCKKIYTEKDLILEGSYKITKKGLIPICPNCKCEKFTETELVRVKQFELWVIEIQP